MNFQNISAWCIRNPVVPIVLFIGLVLAGMVAFSGMKVQNDPDIEFPGVVIVISQPGAAPAEIENQFTQKVEASLRSIQGVQNISSTAREGGSETVVEFQIGTNIIEALNDVKNQVDQTRGSLPDGILEPQVFKIETSSDPIGYFSIASEDMTLEQLSWFVDDTVSKRMLAVPGMAAVERAGGVTREILVVLDPGKMQSLGVTANQVNGALRQFNLNAAGGRAEIAGSRQSVRVLGNAPNAYELSQIDVPLGAGRTVKLSDVARVTDSYGELTSIGKTDGKPVVTFSISRSRGESDVSVYDSAVARLDQLEVENPGIHFTKLFTIVPYVKEQYHSSMAAMVEGAILAVIVVFFFLRDWRATMISAIAIPLSAIPSFWFIDMLGITLNQMSLLALGLVAGVLVDDAIVEVENIVRHMRMGKSAYQASIDAADEIGLAVVATTFSIVAVFLPVGLMPGIPGQFFFNFGWTVVVSVLISLAVARMITPMVAAYFLKAHGEAEHGGGRMMDLYMKVLRWSLDDSGLRAMRARIGKTGSRWAFHLAALVTGGLVIAAVMWLRSSGAEAPAAGGQGGEGSGPSAWLVLLLALVAYIFGGVVNFILGLIAGRIVGYDSNAFVARSRYLAARFLDHRLWMMLVGIVALFFTGFVITKIPQQFFPNSDSDFAMIRVSMVPGTTLEQTDEVISSIADRLAREQEVDLALGIANEGSGMIRLVFKPDRQRDSLTFQREMTPYLQSVPDARANFQDTNPGAQGGTGRAISIMLSGSNPAALEQAANDLVEQMQGVEGAVGPRIEIDLQRPELVITPREDLAASLGVTTQALSQAIRIATLGDIDQNAAKFSLSDRQIPIRVRLAEGDRRNLAVIRNLPVPASTGGSVPLERVADITLGSGPTSIERYNQNRRVFVSADLAPGTAKGDVMNAINALPAMQNLPTGVTNTPVGEDEWLAEMISSFGMALLTAILLVFSVLVLLYRRLVSPLVNMGSLFLAPLGGLLLLWALGQPLSLPVFIGILMLFGIVAKNSILLIDFALEEMALGKSKREAIVEAGHKRAQPIVMTTVAMVAGMVPTALSLAGDSAWRAPMGTVVIGGLILSTLLTLLIVPAGFSLADGLEKRLGPWLRDNLLSYKPGDAAPTAVPEPAE